MKFKSSLIILGLVHEFTLETAQAYMLTLRAFVDSPSGTKAQGLPESAMQESILGSAKAAGNPGRPNSRAANPGPYVISAAPLKE
jgi:hypothetical protein